MADDQGTTIIIKKIKKAAHGHHGGAWKVAYADFVTAMMAFFLVMWIVAMSQPQKEGIQKFFNDPLKYMYGTDKIFSGVFPSNNGRQAVANSKAGGVANTSLQGGLSRLHLLATKLETGMTQFKADVFDFKVAPDRIQFAITAESLFSPGAVLLRPESEGLLNKIASILKNVDASFMVEAHTDDLPAEGPLYATNWELSALRAATVVRFFIEGHYLDPSKMTAMAGAEFRPISDNRTPEGRAKNRRIDIYIIPDVNTHASSNPSASSADAAGETERAPTATKSSSH